MEEHSFWLWKTWLTSYHEWADNFSVQNFGWHGKGKCFLWRGKEMLTMIPLSFNVPQAIRIFVVVADTSTQIKEDSFFADIVVPMLLTSRLKKSTRTYVLTRLLEKGLIPMCWHVPSKRNGSFFLDMSAQKRKVSFFPDMLAQKGRTHTCVADTSPQKGRDSNLWYLLRGQVRLPNPMI